VVHCCGVCGVVLLIALMEYKSSFCNKEVSKYLSSSSNLCIGDALLEFRVL
jgi:hypothetical protein